MIGLFDTALPFVWVETVMIAVEAKFAEVIPFVLIAELTGVLFYGLLNYGMIHWSNLPTQPPHSRCFGSRRTAEIFPM